MKTAPQLWMLRTAFRTVGSVAPEVAARWAEAIFCRPPRHDPRPAEEAFLATGSRFTIRSQNQDLAMWPWGRGPTIVDELLFRTQGLGDRAILRDREVVRRTVEFLQAGFAG